MDRSDGSRAHLPVRRACSRLNLALRRTPTECVGESSDKASLRYAGSEFQFAYRPPRAPKVIPHVGVAGNFIDGVFHVNAPVEDGMDHTRLWTRGGTFSTGGGITYMVTKQAAFTVDASLYAPESEPAPRASYIRELKPAAKTGS